MKNDELYHYHGGSRYNELYHYGVPGMKWGKRKAVYDSSDNIMNRIKKHDSNQSSKKALKDEYNTRTNKAFAKYEKTINDIEKPYKRGQELSKEDQNRSAEADRIFRETETKAKADYKQKIQKLKSDKKVAKQLKKDFIKARSKEIRKGESIVAKLFGDITGYRKYQAEFEYNARYIEDDD